MHHIPLHGDYKSNASTRLVWRQGILIGKGLKGRGVIRSLQPPQLEIDKGGDGGAPSPERFKTNRVVGKIAIADLSRKGGHRKDSGQG
jgi:hypothetical protein